MSNWKPTLGMLRSEAVVQTMLADAASRQTFITDPILRHRWVQTIADELDGFQRTAAVAEILHLHNGQWEPDPESRDVGFGKVKLARADVSAASAIAEETGIPLPDVRVAMAKEVTKRRAGRPKGAKNKRKAKAAKAVAEPVEAAAS